ncbi:MAG: DNA mismatch repair protein MutS [Ruminococcaceae bacterium]|nr:DNA mismatch repair protein MutS [Oscillospiraceae bacterium]
MQKGLTPMMRQYMQIKEQYKDCILFYRLGDFYEMFFNDAHKASEELELTLTGRNCGLDERAPMCGVPHHSAQGYIAKLVSKGYKVAICEQAEDPSLAKDIVKREVIRVVTPGTAAVDIFENETSNNFLACVYIDKENFGVCFADVSTGEMFATDGKNDLSENRLINTLACFKPKEIIACDNSLNFEKLFNNLKKRFDYSLTYYPDKEFELESCREVLDKKFGCAHKSVIEISDKPYAIMAVGSALKYLKETQKVDLKHIMSINYYQANQFMEIDVASRRNLEITETLRDKSKKGSLYSILDKTKTSMGSRLLKKWIEQPLLDTDEINRRLFGVEEFFGDVLLREELIDHLRRINDIEKIVSKVVYGSANARDLVSLKNSLELFPVIFDAIKNSKSEILKSLYENSDAMENVCSLISSAFVDEPPITVREGGMIRDGFDERLDKIKLTLSSGSKIIAEIEAKEREETGIKNLKVAYNRVFGYYIELSKSNIDKAPDRYIRRQTLANCERYITEELKNVENTILGAKEKINDIEYEDFSAVRNVVFERIDTLLSQAKIIATIDVLVALASAASDNGYVKPTVDDSDIIDIKDGRHPIVERYLTDSLFVPNDIYLDTDKNRFSIITGPNMAGKSTYMRQVAIITLMAQIGSFVPAKSCRIGIVDKIFTRVGASDDLAAGQSTFMLEMNEVANILKNATNKSLVILDEIGRGTSTFDGLSIAWATAEYISDKEKIGAKTLFATHYHELIALEENEGINNYSIAVKKHGDDITFLRKIVKGGTDDSFGIEVAYLAGVPDEVIKRAKEVLKSIEKGETKEIKNISVNKFDGDMMQDNEIITTLKNIDISTLTPIEAMNEIYKLQKRISEIYGEN